MPVIAVLGAGASMLLGGATAIGSVIAGTASLMTTFEAVAAVGATIGAIGAVTGDKGLLNAGLIMGGIGGVGALASSAGVFGASATTGSIFGDSGAQSAASFASTLQPVNITSNADTFASAAANAAQSSATQDIISSLQPVDITQNADPFAAGAPIVSGQAPNVMAPLGQQSATTPAITGSSTASSVPTPTPSPMDSGTTGAGAGAVPPSPVMVAQGAGTVPSVPGAASPSAPAVTGTVNGGMSTSEQDLLAGAGATNAQPVSQASLDATAAASKPGIAGLLKFADNHPSVAFGAMQAGGSLLSGLFNPLTTPQIAALNAQAAANRAAAALTQQQLSNMSAPLPVASRTSSSPPVTGAPQGLINTPPPTSAANVTGTANSIPSTAGVGM